MMNTSAVKQQQDLISILTTQLEKEKARLKELQSVETKISKTLETLLPILSEYPEYKKAIASQLGLALPTPPKPRVIEIIDEQENNPTPTITIKEIITELTSTFPEGWKYNETDSTWEMALTETEVTQITQNTNNPTGTIELKEKLYQWNLHETDGELPITILTLQEEKNKDTTSDNNAETDSTYIDESGNAATPPTSDTVENKNTPNNPTVTWYKSNSGEVTVGSEKRYFRVAWNHAQDQHEIKFKKSTDSKKWIKANNSITKLFTEAIALELKAGKNHEVEAILERLYEAAKEIGGKFVGTGTGDVGTLGYFHLDENLSHNNSIEVGYSDSSWWFIRPGHNKVYCDSDVNAFAQVLKGLAAETVKDAEEASTNAKVEKTTDSQGKASDRKYTPPEITKLILAVLGEIDLDPAADDGKHINAKKHYTIADDGLNQEWHGKVFMNPPYSCSGEWVAKLNSEFLNGRVTEAIALLPTSTDTKWFQPLWNQPICFWRGRITFLDENYEVLKSPARQSHCFIYWGENVDKFSQVFSQYGEITLPKIESEPLEVEKTLTLTEKITPLLLENWVIETVGDSQVLIYSSDNKNSNWVTVTELHTYSNTPFIISHETEFFNNAKDIESAIESDICWFKSVDSTDYFEKFIEIINSYKTDLTLQIKDSSTAYIQISQETLGTIFYKDDKTLEIAEREKQIFIESYSIDLEKLIQDINNQEIQEIDE